jgi:hypothetical protein
VRGLVLVRVGGEAQGLDGAQLLAPLSKQFILK